MSDMPKVYVAATGMVTPLGADTATTAAAVKAGISAYQDSDFYATSDERIRMALVPDAVLESALPQQFKIYGLTNRQERMLKLLAVCLPQVLQYIPNDAKVPLFIAGPEPNGKSEPIISKDFLELVSQIGADRFELPMSRIISVGRAGTLAAIRMAFRYFEGDNSTYAIIAGVDSFYDTDLLKRLINEDRLLFGENMDGFIPGEGAGVLLLCKSAVSLRPDNKKRIVLYEPGLGKEPGHRYSDAPYRGDGLSLGVTQALDNSRIGSIKTILSSMNGENHFSKEYGVAVIRNSDAFDENCSLIHPADCLGDLGAAYGAIAIGVFAENSAVTDYRSPCVVTTSSDGEQRAAVVVHSS